MTQSQNSAPQTSATDLARIATQRLAGFWPPIKAQDPETFLAGVMENLAGYSRPTIERAMSATRGLPAVFKFWPSIAEIREVLNGWEEAEHRHREILGRYNRSAATALAGPRPPSMREALCYRFGIRAIPPGWDAVDVTKAAAKHGANFPQVIEEMLRSHHTAPESVFSKAVNEAREAMERRQSEAAE